MDSLPTELSVKTTSIYKLVKIEIYKNDLNLNENSKCFSVEYPVCLRIIGALKHPYYSWRLSDKESACQCRRHGLLPGLGRSSRKGNGNPLPFSCLGNHIHSGAWKATVHGFTKESDVT